ncbi:hypothetical protein [Gordonia neofelifaecis]|uniref:DUF5642 domain-containing protein n=1 Tax=Gordonia neofelifaecis NRRL B-59395 TaxID=644548 RepID=F1YL06_9ACTN|nr:hypothetical protein [Gordonia neofelifaecis]EGD54611.1 hypothetical protein SCNU_13553 [Gordonia neofelifaecis NRRL B-59395]
MTIKRIAGAAVAAGAAATLIAGCSSTDDGAPVPGTQTTTASAVDATKAPTLIIGKADLPAGYQVMDVPKDQIQKVSESILSSTKSAKVTPSNCMQLSAFPDKIDVGKTGFIVAMKSTSVLAETVSVVDSSIDDYRKAVTGDCANLNIEITEGQAAGAKGVVVSKIVDAPKTSADEAIVVQQNSTITFQGTKTKTSMIIGYAMVNGYLVSVQASEAAPGATPDLAAFNKVFAKSVDKVAQKTA